MPLTVSKAASHEGPVYDRIDEALRDFPAYQRFRRGEMSRAEFTTWLAEDAPRPEDIGLDADQLNLSSRFPIDERAYVTAALEELVGAGLLPRAEYPDAEFDELRRAVAERFAHGGRSTYIFPEEARLLFALAHIVAPARAVFLGSYYGYWAVWAVPGIAAAGGTATLVDIDPEVSATARANLSALGMAGSVDVVVDDAIAYASNVSDVDLAVLDAEGPKEDAREELRDKAIYGPITAAVTPNLRPGGLLVAHNVLLENLSDNRYFAGRIDDNRRQFARFETHLREGYDARCLLSTTEGIGVYRRKAAA